MNISFSFFLMIVVTLFFDTCGCDFYSFSFSDICLTNIFVLDEIR